MLNFPIHWRVSTVVNSDERNRTILKLNLNDEWAIVCVLQKDIFGVWKHTSVEIHRKNTAGEFLISGSLRFLYCIQDVWRKNFSHVMKMGSSFTEIVPNLDALFREKSYLIGRVKISEISEKQPTSLENEESKERIQMKSLEELSKDLEQVLNPESSCFADVILKCGGASVPAHKIILSARSPVFAAMFANPMKESCKNEVDITDLDESVLRVLLMYTGKTCDLTVDSAADMLFAADKYQLQDLKAVCLYFLKAALSIQNVWDILVLGDMHSADLKSLAVDYICNKCGEFFAIKNTQKWKTLRKERSDLAMDLLESMVKYRDEKLKR